MEKDGYSKSKCTGDKCTGAAVSYMYWGSDFENACQFVEKEGYKEIHFFGDKTSKGGNDYEIFEGFCFSFSFSPPPVFKEEQ